MQTIKKLSSLEIQKIAAGEVVDRPANIVKELIENSLDAHAKKISIYVRNGGQNCIRIVDNGIGMSPTDAQLCFEHHATSKIISVDDLKSLGTFGFRGEALSSINSVSKITLITRSAQEQQGIKIIRESELIQGQEVVACPTGTDIVINDIFYNVPARKKFLKKAETEFRSITHLFQAFCVAHTDVHFQLFHDDKLVYNCPTANSLENRISQLFEDRISNHLIPIERETFDGLEINGVISNNQLQRYNKNHIFFFVNKRWVKNYALTKALLKGYQNLLLPEKYPLAALQISIDPGSIDVNIHPRKEEVWFANPLAIEKSISIKIKKALELNTAITLDNTITFNQSPLNVSQYQNTTLEKPIQNAFDLPQEIFQPPYANTIIGNIQPKQTAVVISLNFDQTNSYSVLGIAHKTYIMLEHTDGLLFVDQHAAHERILFEQFCNRFTESEIHTFVFPEVIQLVHDDTLLIAHYKDLFSQHGIDVEVFGHDKIIIKAAPIYLKSILWKSFINGVLEEIKQTDTINQQEIFDQIVFKVRAQMACKAAVKAGDILSLEEAKKLINDLYQTNNRHTCPHGRPTSWLLRLYDIEKKFKRVS